jgi:hypothetical protein
VSWHDRPMSPVALAVIYDDPQGVMRPRITPALPVLTGLFAGIAVQAGQASDPASLNLLRSAGAVIGFDAPDRAGQLGAARTATVQRALQLQAEHLLFCEFDRLLTWVERHPDELGRVAQAITARDCTVLGRTPAAFATHPQVQRETEALANDVFALVTGRRWDVTAAARGLSRRAAEAIVASHANDLGGDLGDLGYGTDAAWPLLLVIAGGFDLGYLACDGLEFESADRFAEEVAASGGAQAWKALMDADPQQWAERMQMTRQQVTAMFRSTREQRFFHQA